MIPQTGSFPRDARIKRRREFREIGERGRRHSSGAFILIARSQAEAQPRLGITVSRRVGNAVVRNRVKRWIREWFRRTGKVALAAWGFDAVVIARPASAMLGGQAAFTELDRIVRGLR